LHDRIAFSAWRRLISRGCRLSTAILARRQRRGPEGLRVALRLPTAPDRELFTPDRESAPSCRRAGADEASRRAPGTTPTADRDRRIVRRLRPRRRSHAPAIGPTLRHRRARRLAVLRFPAR